ncbi:hypothetical protein MP638_005383 [Amoeboaphelidium occidentale]|nr:hypothetical protein MP638_005383 [Amoeboaphelidium occidentale]
MSTASYTKIPDPKPVVIENLPTYAPTVRNERNTKLQRFVNVLNVASKAVFLGVGVLMILILGKGLASTEIVEETYIIEDPMYTPQGWGLPWFAPSNYGFGYPQDYNDMMPCGCPCSDEGFHLDICPGDTLVINAEDMDGEDMVLVLELDVDQVPGLQSSNKGNRRVRDASMPNILDAIYDRKIKDFAYVSPYEEFGLDDDEEFIVKPMFNYEASELRKAEDTLNEALKRKSRQMFDIPWMPNNF